MPTELALPNVSVPTATAQTRALRVPAFHRPPVVWLLFLVVVLSAYAPALDGRFFWDDTFLVQSNLLNRSPHFILEAFRHTLFGDSSEFYRPTQTLTYIFDYWCWGLEPFGYHLTNVIIHTCNAFLLFLLLRRVLPILVPSVPPAVTPRLTLDRWALGIALLWALHPVHSAAVAYVSGRADSLAMTFCLTAWLSCERALASRPATCVCWAVAAFVSLLLGLCAKEIAFVWFVLFGCWLFLLRPHPSTTPRAALGTKLVVFGLGIVALICYVGLRQLPPPHAPPPPYPPMPARLVLILRALGDYSRLMVFPDRLYMERQVFAAPGLANPADPAYYNALAVVGVLMLTAFTAGACWPGYGRALRRAGVVWFLCGFLPISNLFRLNASVAEHWLYLPSIGFLMFLAGTALDVPWSQLSAAFALPRTAFAIVVAVATALGGRTWLRAHDWTDGVTFYRQTIRDGGDFPRMREGLALACLERGDNATAAVLLGDLVALYPRLLSTRVNLATVQFRSGRVEEARASLERVAADLTTSDDRRVGPGEFATTTRDLDRLEPPGDPAWTALRRRLLDRAAERFPQTWELLRIGIADHEKSGDLPGALALTQSFADTHWWHAPAYLAAGRLLAAAGRPDEALDAWRQAARSDLRDAEAPAAAAALCLALGQSDEALAWQETAMHRQPDSPRQHLLLARMLDLQGHPTDAVREHERAAQLAQPGPGASSPHF